MSMLQLAQALDSLLKHQREMDAMDRHRLTQRDFDEHNRLEAVAAAELQSAVVLLGFALCRGGDL